MKFRLTLAIVAHLCMGHSVLAEITQFQSFDKEKITQLYKQFYCPVDRTEPTWTGNLTNGNIGQISSDYVEAVMDRVHFIRALSGQFNNISVSASHSKRAQQASYFLSGNHLAKQEAHELLDFRERIETVYLDIYETNNPKDIFQYYRPHIPLTLENNIAVHNGTIGAALVNIMKNNDSSNYVKDLTATAKRGYMPENMYRILSPNLKSVGIGTVEVTLPHNISGKHQMKENESGVMILESNSNNTSLTPEPIMWPPAGYVPYTLIGHTWSAFIPGADTTEAYVTVQRTTEIPGLYDSFKPLEVEIIKDKRGFGDEYIAWTINQTAYSGSASIGDFTDIYDGAFRDKSYRVTIGNVLVSGNYRDYSYEVREFTPTPSWDGIYFDVSILPKVKGDKYDYLRAKLYDKSDCLLEQRGIASSTVRLHAWLLYSPTPEGPFDTFIANSDANPDGEIRGRFEDGFYRFTLLKRFTKGEGGLVTVDQREEISHSEVLHYNSEHGFRKLDGQFLPATSVIQASSQEYLRERLETNHSGNHSDSISPGGGAGGDYSEAESDSKLWKRYRKLRKKKRACRIKKKSDRCNFKRCQSKCKIIRKCFRKVKRKLFS